MLKPLTVYEDGWNLSFSKVKPKHLHHHLVLDCFVVDKLIHLNDIKQDMETFSCLFGFNKLFNVVKKMSKILWSPTEACWQLGGGGGVGGGQQLGHYCTDWLQMCKIAVEGTGNVTSIIYISGWNINSIFLSCCWNPILFPENWSCYFSWWAGNIYHWYVNAD